VNPKYRWLLYVEVVVCFALPTLDVLLGILQLPGWIGDLFHPGDEHSSLPGILYTVSGALGVWGVVGMLRLTHGWRPRRKGLRVLQISVAVGAAAVLLFALNIGFLTGEVWEDGVTPGTVIPFALLVVLPLAGTVHLVFLARRQFLSAAPDLLLGQPLPEEGPPKVCASRPKQSNF